MLIRQNFFSTELMRTLCEIALSAEVNSMQPRRTEPLIVNVHKDNGVRDAVVS